MRFVRQDMPHPGSPPLDKSVINRAVMVAGGRFAPGHLGELTQQVPLEMVDAVLEQTCRVQRRVRALPARVVVYLLLAGCLFAELGYAQVWGRLAAGLGGLGVAVPTASAMSQARRRLGPGPLRELFFLLRGPHPAGVRWRGLLVCAVDGTVMSVADSKANLAAYSKHGGANGGSSYPSLRLLALVSCGTRTVIDAVFGPVSSGETSYAALLLGSLRTGMLLLADRNFGSGPLAAQVRQARADFLIRVRTGNCSPKLPVLHGSPTGRGSRASAASPSGSATRRSRPRPAPGRPPAAAAWSPRWPTRSAIRPLTWPSSTTSDGRSRPPTSNSSPPSSAAASCAPAPPTASSRKSAPSSSPTRLSAPRSRTPPLPCPAPIPTGPVSASP